MHKIYVLGMGPGSKDYILPITIDYIKESDVLIGGKRNLQYFEELNKEKIYIGADLEKIMLYTRTHRREKKIAFLLSGDTGFYSMLKALREEFSPEEMIVVPGISSFQYLMAKIGEPWQDAYVGSLHGRPFDLISALNSYEKIVLLTDGIYSPKWIANTLIENGFENKLMIVGENLSYQNERIQQAFPKEILKMPDFKMAVVVIKNEEKNVGV